MKKVLITYACLGLLSLSTTSCSDFLTLQPEHQINELGYWKNEADFETAIVGLYSGLQSYAQNLMWVNEVGTDNATFQLPQAESHVTGFDYWTLSPTNAYVNNYWNNNYGTISRANTILNRLSNVDFTSKSRMEGECKFIRALSYFQLVRLFGDVSISTKEFSSPNEINNYDFSRKPVEEIYKLILNDLTDAEKLLANDEIPSNKGKVSIGAIKTLLGKIYLTKKEYDLAAQKLKEVIDMQAYSLESDFASLFSEGNDDKVESILEIEFASGNQGEGFDFGNFYPNVINMDVFPGGIIGGGRCVPSITLWNAYEEGDIRRDAGLGNKLPMNDGTTTDYFFCKKFVDYSATTMQDGGVNFTLLRYADVLLMYAEALNELNKTNEALPYINQIRQRAQVSSLMGLSQSQLRLAIEKERQLELCFEGHRWFDLKRTDRLLDVINEDFKNLGLTFSAKEYGLLLPIPQNQRDIDPNLTQNPGY